MGKGIYVTSYEVIDDGVAVAAKHYAEIDAARRSYWEFAKSKGAKGFRPTDTGVRSLLVAPSEVPVGWRSVGSDRGLTEIVPRRTTRVGKEALEEIRALPRSPTDSDLADLFGWNPPELPLDGYRIYFPTSVRISLPADRYFLRLPRFANDGWPGDPRLKEIPESTLMLAIEGHNARLPKEAA